jgi:hypothetical protein
MSTQRARAARSLENPQGVTGVNPIERFRDVARLM